MRKSQLIVVSAVIGGLSALSVNGIANFNQEARAADVGAATILLAQRAGKDDPFRGVWVLRGDGRVFFCKIKGYANDGTPAELFSPKGCLGVGTAG